jgi:hypothetical protein
MVHRRIAIDDGAFKGLDLCEPHDGFLFGLLATALDDEDDPDVAISASPMGLPLVIQQAMQGRAAAIAPPLPAVQPEPEPQPTLPLEELETPAEEEPAEPERVYILCRDCDPEAKVEYARRNDHARTHGKPATQILWTLPDGRPLPYPCNLHAECEEVGFGYTTERGLDNHLNGLAPPPGGKSKRGKKKAPVIGRAKEGVLQVVCPEEHRKGAPTPYRVDIRNRQGHAQHHGVDAPYIAWENPDEIPMPFVCMEHKACAEAGGYPFPSAQSLLVHGNKSRHWEKAPTPDASPQPAAAEAA